jgi:Icc protein
MKRSGSVTQLNRHIHQGMHKVERNVKFHTAMTTAIPQTAPGAAPSPGPMKVPAERLQSVRGITDVSFVAQRRELAVVDATLSAAPANKSESGL